MSGRTLAIGDIHGCDRALELLLERLRPEAGDTLVVLGDAVDRGPHTRRVLDMLLELGETCRLRYILGNHDEMMLEAVAGRYVAEWLSFGGRETLASYDGRFERIPPRHVAFLRDALPLFEGDSEIFVHATLDPERPLDQQTSEALRWAKLTGAERPHPSGKRVICGHTAQRSGRPLILDGWVCIDTCVYGPGFLTALEVGPDTVHQASQSGERRGPVPLAELE